MKKHLKVILPVLALVLGLLIGLGIGQLQVSSAKKVAQDKIREVNKKLAFLQTRLLEEQSKPPQVDPQCLADLTQAQKKEKAVRGELKKSKDKVNDLEAKADKVKREYQALEAKYGQETKHRKQLETDLRKTIGDKLALEKELKKTSQNLGRCEANNAKLCIIANEILKKYQTKGVGAALLQKEPLTQIKRVEFEHFNQQYKDEIEKQKFQKKQ